MAYELKDGSGSLFRFDGSYGYSVSNGDQVNRIAHLARKRGKSVDFTGYWQRHIAG